MRPALTSLLAILAVGCGGPSVGEIVSREILMSVSAISTDPDVAAIESAEGGVAVSRLYFSAALSLLPCREDVEALVLPLRGYDVLGPSITRERVNTAVTELCGVRLDIEALDEARPEGVPEGAAWHVEGTNSDGTSFAITSETARSIALEAVDGRSFGDVPLVLALDVSVLLAGASPSDEQALTESVSANLPAALAVYSDADADGGLDEEELTPVAVAPAAD